MVEIQPYEFKKKTNIEEHNDIVSKVNEIVDVINDTQMDTIDSRLTAVEGDVTALESEVSTINNELDTKADKTEIPDTSTFATKTEVDAVDTKVDAIDSQLDTMQTEIDGLLKEVVDGVAMSSTAHGTVQVQINHEDGSNDISAPIDLGLVEEGGIVLKSGTTDRSFKLIVTLTDGTSWQTNDFVIPEGGGTDVSVTSISIAQGTGADKIQVKIGLSDGSTISSNDWTVVTPSEFSALGTRVTTAEGNITKNTGDISELDGRVQALEDTPGYALKPATATRLGGVKIGAGIIVQGDGTISVDKTQIDTAAVASTVKFTADASKVTLHADSLAGSEFTKDIPQASQGGAGTIDQASYAKIAATESKVNALAPSVSVNEEADPPTITIGINGKSAQANLPSGGGVTIKAYTADNFNEFIDDVKTMKIGDSFTMNNLTVPKLSIYPEIDFSVSSAVCIRNTDSEIEFSVVGPIFSDNGGIIARMLFNKSNGYVSGTALSMNDGGDALVIANYGPGPLNKGTYSWGTYGVTYHFT